ncbi:MAG: hypothetical protein JWM80_3604 [Cyanobacteria bacterium RYN_339]|nr:hypothetical protein [Cyanobacteria bacterium RYN_339]
MVKIDGWILARNVGIGLTAVCMAVSLQLRAERPVAAITDAPPEQAKGRALRFEPVARAIKAAQPFGIEARDARSVLIERATMADMRLATLRGSLVAHRAVLPALAEARRQPAWSPDPKFAYVDLKGAVAVGLLATRLAFDEGEAARGVRTWLDAAAIGWRLGQVPHAPAITLIEGQGLVRFALMALALEQAQLLKAPTPALEELLAGLTTLTARREAPHNLLWGERDEILATMRTGNTGQNVVRDLGLDDVPFASAIAAGRVQEAVPAVKQVYDRRMKMMDAHDWRALRRDKEADDVQIGGATQLLHPGAYVRRVVMQLVLMDDSHFYEREGKTTMALDGLRIGVAAELYRREHGAAPASLDALVPRWLQAAPIDFFADGKPLRLAGGKVWSVGPDGEDQQGQADDPWFADKPTQDLVFFPLPAQRPPASGPALASTLPPLPKGGNDTLSEIFGIDSLPEVETLSTVGKDVVEDAAI